MKSILSSILLSVGIVLAGCATPPDKIEAAYVSPITYESYTCEQIAQEAARVSDRAAQALGIHRGPGAEHHRIVRYLQAFEMKVMLGEGDEIESQGLDLAHDARRVAQTTLVVVGILAGKSTLELLRRGPRARQNERTQT